MDEDFDDGYGDPSDYGMSQSDFDTATSIGQAYSSGNDDNIAQAIANATAQPQVGMNRSNIIGTKNYDPQFAAAFDISRGLDPTNNFGGTGGLAVPSYLRPQTPGNLILNEAGDRMMYGSPVERFLQEDLPPIVRGFQNIGIGGLLSRLGNNISEAFADAKRAVGLSGDAAGGLKAEDLQPTMGTLDPSDRFLGNMSQQGAGMNVTDPVVNTPSVNMGSIPQVSPTFDAFGNVTRDANASRLADRLGQINAGIASLLPEQNREARLSVDDAVREEPVGVEGGGFGTFAMDSSGRPLLGKELEPIRFDIKGITPKEQRELRELEQIDDDEFAPKSPFTNFNAPAVLDDFERGLIERQIENNKRNRDRLLSGNKMADANTFMGIDMPFSFFG